MSAHHRLTREVRESSVCDGLGVFALVPFEPGEIIERCQIIELPAEETQYAEQTSLYGYIYSWGEGGVAVALGDGSLYNHSYEPNARYLMDYEDRVIEVSALVPISAGDEILFNYNGDPYDGSELWFDVE